MAHPRRPGRPEESGTVTLIRSLLGDDYDPELADRYRIVDPNRLANPKFGRYDAVREFMDPDGRMLLVALKRG